MVSNTMSPQTSAESKTDTLRVALGRELAVQVDRPPVAHIHSIPEKRHDAVDRFAPHGPQGFTRILDRRPSRQFDRFEEALPRTPPARIHRASAFHLPG